MTMIKEMGGLIVALACALLMLVVVVPALL